MKATSSPTDRLGKLVAWSFLSLNTLPRPLDIVWCRFPIDELPKKPGPKPRPGLVRGLGLHKDGRRALVEVSYGSSKKAPADFPHDLHICNTSEMNEAGLPQATCFVLDRCLWLPWASEFFERREDGTGPVIGRLPPTAVMQLEALKVNRRRTHR